MDRIGQVAALIDGITDPAELRQVFELCRRRSSAMQQVRAGTFRPGQRVSFRGRGNEVLTGTVAKVNVKTVSVEVPTRAHGLEFNQTWRVSASILRAAE